MGCSILCCILQAERPETNVGHGCSECRTAELSSLNASQDPITHLSCTPVVASESELVFWIKSTPKGCCRAVCRMSEQIPPQLLVVPILRTPPSTITVSERR